MTARDLSRPSRPEADSKSAPGLTGSMGTWQVVLMVAAAAAPLTVVGAGVPIYMIAGNGAGIPAMFVAAALILALFAVGFSAMTPFVHRPGAFFTYIGFGLGRPLGLGSAYNAVLTYTAIQVSVWCLLGVQLNQAIVDLNGPDAQWWIYALAVMAVVGVLGYRHIDLSAKVLGVALIFEIGIVIILNLVIMFKGGDAGLSFDPFTPLMIFQGAPALGLMFAMNGFLGFESTAIYRDEVRDPDRTIPRATYISVALIGFFYAWSAWSMVMAWGVDRVLREATNNTAGMMAQTAINYLGHTASVIVRILLVTSLFACVLSFHNVIARYQYAMAGVRAMPSRLAAVHPRHSSPFVSSMVQTGTAAALVGAIALFDLDPSAEGATWLAGISALGIMLMMALTSLAVLIFFRRIDHAVSTWKSLVAPTLALIGLTALLVVVVKNFALLVGGSQVLAAWFVGLVVAVNVLGIVQAQIIRRRQPSAYATLTDPVQD